MLTGIILLVREPADAPIGPLIMPILLGMLAIGFIDDIPVMPPFMLTPPFIIMGFIWLMPVFMLGIEFMEFMAGIIGFTEPIPA